MKILGTGKSSKKGKDDSREYIVLITEAEADMITGITGKPHISGRYKPGAEVNISVIYDKVKLINDKHEEIVAAAIELKSDADEIATAIPLT